MLRRESSLGSEEKPVLHYPQHGDEHVGAVIDEVSQTERASDLRLLVALPAEVEVRGGNSGHLPEAMVLQPATGPILDPRAGLGNQSHAAAEEGEQLPDRW